MTKAEFEKRAGKVTNEEFDAINYVYTFHPCISDVSGKDEIATLWGIGGMRLIEDMTPTAHRAEHLENAIFKTRRELEVLENEYSTLKEG